MRNRKIFAGAKVRAIRTETGLTQAAFSGKLGISTSYLNQIENNQRHLTASVMLALAERLGVDIASFSQGDGERLIADLTEVRADPLLAGSRPSDAETQLVVHNAPGYARALLIFQQALRRTEERLAEIDDRLERDGSVRQPSAYDEVRDFFHYADNYIHDLDEAAEYLASQRTPPGPERNFEVLEFLARHLEKVHGVRLATDLRGSQLRRFAPETKILHVSHVASISSRAFQIAHQIGLLEYGEVIDTVIERAGFATPEAGSICRVGLANYFAGALILPYGDFLKEARRLRHDLHLIADHFDVSLEQVAHRLSTLQRPGAHGIPFFFAKLDKAGNITKRHSATKLQFARFGAACPLWNAHSAFATPDRIIRQLAETIDGYRYLNLALAISKPSGGFKDQVRTYALALGCEISHAKDIVYGDDLPVSRSDVYEPIGISCRICERSDCHQRAVPPIRRRLQIDHDRRDIVPFEF